MDLESGTALRNKLFIGILITYWNVFRWDHHPHRGNQACLSPFCYKFGGQKCTARYCEVQLGDFVLAFLIFKILENAVQVFPFLQGPNLGVHGPPPHVGQTMWEGCHYPSVPSFPY